MGPKGPSWQTKESRHYCTACNAWMGNDRQSILLHENGKKHKENVEKSLQGKRDDKAAQDKQAAQMRCALKAMEQSALQAIHTGTDGLYYDTTDVTSAQPPAYGAPDYAPPLAAAAPVVPSSKPPSKKSKAEVKRDKKEWNALKQQRQAHKTKDDDQDEEATQKSTLAKRRTTIAPEEGHYTVVGDDDDRIYLEAAVFAEVLEEEMPIQIWTGSNLATAEEKRLLHHGNLWVDGLVAAIRRRNPTGAEQDDRVLDVAYLKNPTDEEETLERGVLLHRIRILLGGHDSIPKTLEEARILALGGEEIQFQDHGTAQAELEEATGLSGWSTVAIKRTTVHQQAREERAQQRQKERRAKRAAEEAVRQAEIRKMEESKVQNAEDSALGAYDVWSQTQKGGYKGVDIHSEAHVTVEDTAKRLAAKGEMVAFKKTKVKDRKKRIRTTSADDD